MPKIKYEEWAPKDETLAVVAAANHIIDDYAAQGYDLTLRQLYYQFVSRDLIPNRQSEYKRLGDIVSKARRAGLVDWDAIVDRTRDLEKNAHWSSASSIVKAISEQFAVDRWASQSHYVEVWFEKDALMGVFERAASRIDVPYLSCRGYPSDSTVWAAAQRLRRQRALGGVRNVVILHFGDHDPSGIDMTRDITDRLGLFGAANRVEVRRLALNMNQVEQYEPPPNPAKETDSRFAGYQAQYGDESWELDALEPTVLGGLVTKHVRALLDLDAWNESLDEERDGRRLLAAISANWDEVTERIRKDYEVDDIAIEEPDNFEEEDENDDDE